MSELRYLKYQAFYTDEDGRRLFAPNGLVQPCVVPDAKAEKTLARWNTWTRHCTGLASFAGMIAVLCSMDLSSISDLFDPTLICQLLGIGAIQLLLIWLIMRRATKGLERVSNLSTFNYFANRLAKKRHPQELGLLTICCFGMAYVCFLMAVLAIVFRGSIPIGLLFLLLTMVSIVCGALFGYAYRLTDPDPDD